MHKAATYPAADLPAQFSPLVERREPGDEPWRSFRSRTMQRHLSEMMGAHGSRVRLSGHGGDDVLRPMEGVPPDLLRYGPVGGLRRLRARYRWSIRDMLGSAFDRTPYSTWVRRAGAALVRGEQHRVSSVPDRWGAPVGLPNWLTPEARSAVGELLTCADLRPLDPSPVHHTWLQKIHQSGVVAGELDRDSMVATGVACHAPFLDDQVIDACLAVPPGLVLDPRVYKPVLSAAMVDVLPDEIRERTTKDHCTPEWLDGLRASGPLLAEWCATSRLAERGIVDAQRLRRVLLNPELIGAELPAVERTLAVEAWLRDRERTGATIPTAVE